MSQGRGDGDDRAMLTDGPPAWRVQSVPLGGSSLSQALQADPTSHGWLAARPTERAAWTAWVHRVQVGAQGQDWLTPLAPAFAAAGRAADRLARAADHGVVVTTGQQPGLFGGPGYTWSKAISALAMADLLEEQTGVPVAPVFWAATDDADWIEAASTQLATMRGLQTLQLAGPATEGIALADVVLGPLEEALQALRAASGSAAQRSVLELVEQAYVPHATIGAAYVQLLRAVLEPLGIAVLDAAHPAVRRAADPLLRRALQQATPVHDALMARTQAMTQAGHLPQVDVVESLSLVFRTETAPSGRGRVRARVPLSDASRVAREAEAGTLGANVLLRPVIERALLPTVAYHAGPGEYAYFAQVSAVAAALQLASPLAVPRWAGEVIEARMDALRDTLGLTDALLRDPHAAEQHVARAALSTESVDALDRLRVAIETQVRALRDATSGTDELLSPAVVDGLAAQLELRVERFERRMVAAVKRREGTRLREVAAVRAALRPDGHSPERRLNLMPMLARYGVDILEAMRREARAHVERLVHGR